MKSDASEVQDRMQDPEIFNDLAFLIIERTQYSQLVWSI